MTTGTGNIDSIVSGAGSVLGAGVGVIDWGKNMFGKYAMWIFGLVGLFFLSKMFKIKL
jgi:hypothetical protein